MSRVEAEEVAVSMLLDALGTHAATAWPDRVLIEAEHVLLQARACPVGAPITIERAEERPASVTLRASAAAGPMLSARLHFAPVRPAEPSWSDRLLAKNLVGANAKQLYALEHERPVDAAPFLQVVRSVQLLGSSELVAELTHRDPPTEGELNGPRPAAPATLEGMLQAARWLWYAFSGQGARVEAIERITWYRLPRPGVPVRVQALFRGTRAEVPVFDVLAFEPSGRPLIQVTSLRLAPTEPWPDVRLPRVHWQRFLAIVSASGTAGAVR